MKRVFQDSRYKNRELEVLLDLNRLESGELVQEIHPNILDCLQHYYTDGERVSKNIFLLSTLFMRLCGSLVTNTLTLCPH